MIIHDANVRTIHYTHTGVMKKTRILRLHLRVSKCRSSYETQFKESYHVYGNNGFGFNVTLVLSSHR